MSEGDRVSEYFTFYCRWHKKMITELRLPCLAWREKNGFEPKTQFNGVVYESYRTRAARRDREARAAAAAVGDGTA